MTGAKSKAVLAALAIAAPPAASAQTMKVQCDIASRVPKHFQPGKIDVTLDLRRLQARVSDDVTVREGHSKGVPAEIEALTDKKMTITWKLKAVSTNRLNSSARLQEVRQRLTIYADDTALLITLAPNQTTKLEELRADARCPTQS